MTNQLLGRALGGALLATTLAFPSLAHAGPPASAEAPRAQKDRDIVVEGEKKEKKRVCERVVKTGTNLPRMVCRNVDSDGETEGMDSLNELREERERMQQNQNLNPL